MFESGFGGLLCDDMGLGKTHQVMALMTALQLQNKKNGPFLVVCPMTVISHWQKKISEHAPTLNCGIYHGGERNLERLLDEGETVLTCYGILLRDIEQIKQVYFTLAVFDEIQNIKNAATRTYRAAKAVHSEMNLLKQICDHPALVEKDIDSHDRYKSGKFDLFRELLVESLDSGHHRKKAQADEQRG